MFCNECGSKLSATDKVCRICGMPADQGEACGGFWGLTGMKPPVPAPQPGPNPGHQPGPNPGHQPGPNPGHQPGPRPGHQPSPNPGHQPGPRPGHQPGPNSGHQPGPKPAAQPALSVWQIACGVLLVLLLIQSFRIGGLKRELKVQTDDYCDRCYEALYPEETTIPGTTVPETTVPETTVPETTVPETTVPETTVPETTVPETTIPETVVPEDGDSIFGTDAGTGISSQETNAPQETEASEENP